MRMQPEKTRTRRCRVAAAPFLALAFGSGCLSVKDPGTAKDTYVNPVAQQQEAAKQMPGARIRFYASDFYTLTSPRPDSNCAGDARIYRDPLSYAAFDANAIEPTETIKPSFIRNIAVDVTDANFSNSQNLASRCSYVDTPEAPPSNACAIFDRAAITGMHAGSLYDTGFYLFQDSECANASPIASSDPASNRLLAGAAYIDLDRSGMGSNENLLRHVTFFPLGPANQAPSRNLLSATESPYFRIHLQRTGLKDSDIRFENQPRYLHYFSDNFAKVVDTISVLAPPAGQPKEESILLPVSIDKTIDRILIERYSGSSFLVEASLYRLGNR